MSVELNFDATAVEPTAAFEALPAGWYDARIDESEMKPTKDGSGAYLKLRFSIIGGKYDNQKVFQNLNLRNANPTAVEIAMRNLSAIAHAVGVLQVQNSAQLHGIPLKIKIKVRKDPTGQYGDSNEISAYENINKPVQMADAYGAAAAAPAAAPAGFAAPAAPAMPSAAPAAVAGAAAQPWAQTATAAPAPAAQPAAAPAWATGAPVQTAPAAQAAQAAAEPAMTPEQTAAVEQAQAAPAPWAQ